MQKLFKNNLSMGATFTIVVWVFWTIEHEKPFNAAIALSDNLIPMSAPELAPLRDSNLVRQRKMTIFILALCHDILWLFQHSNLNSATEMKKMAVFHFHVMLMQGVRLLRKPIDHHPGGANIHLWMSSNDDEIFFCFAGKLISILQKAISDWWTKFYKIEGKSFFRKEL